MRPDSAAARPRPRPPAGAAAARPARDLARPLPAWLSWGAMLGFAAGLAVAVALDLAPWWLAAAYAGLSLLSFIAYGIDKAAAGREARRVPERTLLLLDVLGGWPGALAAQQLFRHKTRKRVFRRAFWGRVALNLCVVVAAITWAGTGGALPVAPG
ncbi:DUF1294 domain-containing protein [Agromyces arachidis]|uniref:DUF1294 domain-containing protein n=1 Tax=Agromyces arachidis TaxID=766966 RepID=UPI004055D738